MSSPIELKSGEITGQVYHVDLHQYGMSRLCSVFILETPECVLLMDTGTSDDIRAITRFLKKKDIPLGKVKYLVPSHFHFDHFGGGWKLWNKIKKYNPGVKVLTTKETMEQLQDTKLHMFRAHRTFGDFVGRMEPLPVDAYEIVKTDTDVTIPGLDSKQGFRLLHTPGHTPDHVSPVFIENGNTKFCFTGEAAGTLFHSQKLVTFGTSMPPDFSYKNYMESLQKIIDLEPENAGYCHFGAVVGKENVMEALHENQEFSTFFRDFVMENFTKTGSVRAVVEKFMTDEAPKRTDLPRADLLVKILVALVYGQCVDLKLKDPK
ncbi:MAG: MBL fold metallo-hydrolase [Promethearchaeota archaeon]